MAACLVSCTATLNQSTVWDRFSIPEDRSHDRTVTPDRLCGVWMSKDNLSRLILFRRFTLDSGRYEIISALRPTIEQGKYICKAQPTSAVLTFVSPKFLELSAEWQGNNLILKNASNDTTVFVHIFGAWEQNPPDANVSH
jgi:hypothetical protein